MSHKLLASADLHLGRSSTELTGDSELASTRTVWERMLDRAIQEEVDGVLLSGDIVDRDNRYFEAFEPLRKAFQRSAEANIPVFMVAGNHDFDVLTQLFEHQEHENVHLLGRGGEWELLSLDQEEGSPQILGWSFPDLSYDRDPSAEIPRKEIDPSRPCIGLLHGDIHSKESRYAPIDVANLKEGPADAWILGHIHKPEEVNPSAPSVHYPGSPQALSPKETGEHGVLMVEVGDDKGIDVERIPLSPVRYERLKVDLSQAPEEGKVRDRLTDVLFDDASEKGEGDEALGRLVYDLLLVGEHPRPEKAREWAEGIVEDHAPEVRSGLKAKIRKVHSELMPAIEDLEGWAQERSPAGKLAETILKLEQEENTEFIDQVISKWQARQKSAMKSETYSPLQKRELSEASRQEAARYILSECKRLLRQFQMQRNASA